MIDALSYLSLFGYLAGRTTAEAVTAFQTAFGLPETGEVDGQTERAMTVPRCGLPDHPMATEEARWRKRRLSYWVDSYVGGLSQTDQDDLLGQAWVDWMEVADLTITRAASKGEADMVISTGRGRDHGFDGTSGVLAWAQLPPGDDRQLLMRFDLDETWTRNLTERGTLFRNVACHEFGHLLGLDHSRQRSALMAPYYAPGVSGPQADDASRIQAYYGAPAKPPKPPTGPPSRNIVKFTVEGKVDEVSIPGWRCTKMAGT